MKQEPIILGQGTRFPLKGMLTLPDDLSAPVPALVLVHGSGSSNMDEKVGKLTPFKDIAEGLAERGIACIRYDKRSFAHGRLLAARMLGLEEVPVDYQDYENEAAEWADMVADNKIAELSNMDEDELNAIIRELDGQIDLELTGFSDSEINSMLASVSEDLEAVPDNVPLDADNDSTVTILPFIAYGAKKIYMQPDEAERFERLLKEYSSVHGNYNGLALELMEFGDSNFRNDSHES